MSDSTTVDVSFKETNTGNSDFDTNEDDTSETDIHFEDESLGTDEEYHDSTNQVNLYLYSCQSNAKSIGSSITSDSALARPSRWKCCVRAKKKKRVIESIEQIDDGDKDIPDHGENSSEVMSSLRGSVYDDTGSENSQSVYTDPSQNKRKMSKFKNWRKSKPMQVVSEQKKKINIESEKNKLIDKINKLKEKKIKDKLRFSDSRRSEIDEIKKNCETQPLSRNRPTVFDNILSVIYATFDACKNWSYQLTESKAEVNKFRWDAWLDYLIRITQIIVFTLGSFIWKILIDLLLTAFDVIYARISTIGMSIPIEMSHVHFLIETLKFILSCMYDLSFAIMKISGKMILLSFRVLFRIMIVLATIISELVSKLILVPLMNTLIIFFDVDYYVENCVEALANTAIRSCKDVIQDKYVMVHQFCLKATRIECVCFKLRYMIFKAFYQILSLRNVILMIPKMASVMIDVVDMIRNYVGILTDCIYFMYLLISILSNALYYFYFCLQVFIHGLHSIANLTRKIHDCFGVRTR